MWLVQNSVVLFYFFGTCETLFKDSYYRSSSPTKMFVQRQQDKSTREPGKTISCPYFFLTVLQTAASIV